ncbi:hypothetical protein SCP_0905010 [Sparassis crispa]|uniref:Smr domain-containing protein n=1 Tax=Sparassis crispa TaxID=139825 RepID=A0A401GWR7_9APHY|nr:hypothetical protein SCP_0905010 [Sparassis crispa]GBE86622.1 hypothetical protein SCP_0905010 [Sparassis crispa]
MLDLLQTEFCPPLDSSLIAAIAADYLPDSDNFSGEFSQDDLQAARAVLADLAAEAERQLSDEDALSERISRVRICPTSITDETSSSHDYFSGRNSNSNTATSSTSDVSDQHSFSSPIGFLQAAFPHIPIAKLKSTLADSGDAEDVDMESIVEGLLTNEYVRDLQERGLEDDELPVEFDGQWLTVESKKKKIDRVPPWTPKKGNKRGTTFTIIDIRQKQHTRATPSEVRIAGADPWTQVSSVASYLSTLLPEYSASYFQSIFHAPEHPTPAKALRAALLSMSSAPSNPRSLVELSSENTSHLFSMLGLLSASPIYATLNAEERSQLAFDVELALRATHGQPDPAIDLVWLLRDLESDSVSGEMTWGVYHAPVPPPSSSSSSSLIHPPRGTPKLPTGPPPVQAPPSPPSSSRFSHYTPPANTWKTVPQRTPTSHEPHPLVSFIPAYAPSPGKRKVRGGGNGLGKGGKGDVGELRGSMARHRGRAMDLMERRREALRQAGMAWQRGNARTHGGEVALFFAERARKLQQEAREEQMDAVREMVQAKRMTSANRDTVDLHGTTTTEAVRVVKDILSQEGASAAKPLRIITGRGKHSANGVGVLGPAVKSALVEDGWMVGAHDGGLVVRGRAAWRT